MIIYFSLGYTTILQLKELWVATQTYLASVNSFFIIYEQFPKISEKAMNT